MTAYMTQNTAVRPVLFILLSNIVQFCVIKRVYVFFSFSPVY